MSKQVTVDRTLLFNMAAQIYLFKSLVNRSLESVGLPIAQEAVRFHINFLESLLADTDEILEATAETSENQQL